MTIRKVLVVDDEPDIRRIGQLSLEVLGRLQVVAVASGDEALRRAADERPDVILLDARMPGMDGLQTLVALKAQPSTADIPVIFMSACTDAVEVRAFQGCGAVGVIKKPFDPMTLAGEICRLAGGRR